MALVRIEGWWSASGRNRRGGFTKVPTTVIPSARLAAATAVTADLRTGNRITNLMLDESLLAGAISRAEARRIADAAELAATLVIHRFAVGPAADVTARLQGGPKLVKCSMSAWSPAADVTARLQGGGTQTV